MSEKRKSQKNKVIDFAIEKFGFILKPFIFIITIGLLGLGEVLKIPEKLRNNVKQKN